MNLFNQLSFAKQLIIYLLIVLIATFIFISWTLTHSVRQFIGNNAYTQVQTFAENTCVTFEREMHKIESIPDDMIHLSQYHSLKYFSILPHRLLETYPQLISCSLHTDTSNPDTTKHIHIMAIRQPNGKINSSGPSFCNCPSPNQGKIIRQTKHGWWIYSNVNQEKTIAFCYPLYGHNHQYQGFFKLDFPQKTITDIICNCKFHEYGQLFIVDSTGNYLVYPLQGTTSACPSPKGNLYLKQKILKGGTGSITYTNNNIRYFVHYTPISYMNWYLGIICPYKETLRSSHKLYGIIFICLGGGLLFLFIGTINIVHRLSFPLKQLAHTARQIADGQFDTPLPQLKSSHEIHELYDSFRYLQHNLINYIEKLKISTAEKEQRNSEMYLARKIQQRFLPRQINLPFNIQLAAELRQCREVGGDLYEYLMVENRLYFAIGDVSGKGTPAALYMVSVLKLFRYVANSQTSPAQICNIINKHMCEDTEDDMYITMFLGILDTNTGILTYTNAGHPYPLVVYENGTTYFLNKYPDVPIGILESHCFKEHMYTFPRNTSLLLYTDGVTDAENPAGQFFSKEKMIECISRADPTSPSRIVHTILNEISKHMANRKQTDDLTLLLIRFNSIS